MTNSAGTLNVLDASAIVAILIREHEADVLRAALNHAVGGFEGPSGRAGRAAIVAPPEQDVGEFLLTRLSPNGIAHRPGGAYGARGTLSLRRGRGYSARRFL